MSDVTVNDAIEHMLGVLQEAFSGPPDAFAYFTDRGPGAGLTSLFQMPVEEAIRRTGVTPGSSVAAQVHHLIFALQASAAFVQGEARGFDWASSWKLPELDEEGWQAMADRLQDAKRSFAIAVRDHAGESSTALGAALGAVAHVAYHLGAIRRMRAAVNA